jgi:sugar lactone lactonase YvrE
MMAAGSFSCKKNRQGGSPPPTDKKAVVSTIAGDGSDAFENGPVMSAKFHSPVDVAVAPDGTIYVADYNDHRIRKIAGGQVSTLAGNDSFGIVNGNGGMARFKYPYRIAVDPNGNCYVLDQVDPRIRKITAIAEVSTYAGSMQPGFLDAAALTAQFQVNAEGIASDGVGNIYIGDTFNERIRAISLAGQVSTAAGDGSEGFKNGPRTTAQFRFPGGIACDRQGNIYVADAGNLCIRKITADGMVSTLAGSGLRGTADGDGSVAQFDMISDVVADSQGDLYVIDGNRIRKVTPQGAVSTIAGSTAGYADGDGATAKFKDPGGLGIDAQDNIYVADINNNRIRKISFQ